MIFAVIPVYNRIASTLRCIQSIIDQAAIEISIVVVDDGSSDGTTETLRDVFPDVTILRGTGSLFWTGAIHYAINYILPRATVGDWVLLINNDVVLEASTISALLTVGAAVGRPALLSALSIDASDRTTIVASGTKVTSWFLNRTRHVYQGARYCEIPVDQPISIDLATARCLLHPVEVFLQIGNYNATYFPHYGGDCEFSARAKLHGYEILIVPTSRVFLEVVPREKRISLVELLPYVWNRLFSIHSSINVRDKLFFALVVVPWYAKISYFVVGVAKTIALTIMSVRFR